MLQALFKILQFVFSGLVAKLLLSGGIGLYTAVYVKIYVDDYLQKSKAGLMSLPPEVTNLLGIAKMDNVISIMFGGLVLVATLKSMKLVFFKT